MNKPNLPTIPINPGCYLFKDDKDNIIYIGKAKNLKKRVTSYFSKKHDDEKTNILVSQISSVDFIVTDNETEALILENNLIKKNQPKYNINLKDSKRYAFIRLTDERFPRLVLARSKHGNGEFFGPFISAATRDYIHRLLIKTFKIRTCKKLPKKACLRYHINLCDAPCIHKVSEEDYMSGIEKARMVLRGKTNEIIPIVKDEMKKASSANNFERAIDLRNQLESLEYLEEKQKMEHIRKYNQDILNYIVRDGVVYLILFNIYKGVLENKQEYEFDYTADFLEQFLAQYYSDFPVPKQLILPVGISDALGEFLRKIRGKKVEVIIPKIGEKKQLLELVKKNIEISFFAETNKLLDLKAKLRLNSMPKVIECFDISHLSGTNTVASMVQFRNGKPDKTNYRRFKIQSVDGIDDFKSMAEVVRRRYYRLMSEQSSMPDLIVIDGGKGQLSSALNELKRLGLKIPIISLAKKFEEVFVPGMSIPIKLSPRSDALKLLQQVRDEAHRFAINYNRLLRKKKITDAHV